MVLQSDQEFGMLEATCKMLWVPRWNVEFAVKFMQIYWRKEVLTRSEILKVFVM